MKHKQTPSDKLGATVAPRRGAWVETCVLGFIGLDPLVAPRRGAWVETPFVVTHSVGDLVAPRRGAWVETH